MPRRPPGALRAIPRSGAVQVPKFSRAVDVDAARFEARRAWSSAVLGALARYEQFVRRPERVLYIPWPDCPCCDPIDARETLERAMSRLPPMASAELRRVVARLDS